MLLFYVQCLIPTIRWHIQCMYSGLPWWPFISVDAHIADFKSVRSTYYLIRCDLKHIKGRLFKTVWIEASKGGSLFKTVWIEAYKGGAYLKRYEVMRKHWRGGAYLNDVNGSGNSKRCELKRIKGRGLFKQV